MSPRPVLRVAGLLALAAVYFGAAKLGLSLAYVADQVTVVWPPTGIALTAVLLFGWGTWPGIALGAFLANVTVPAPVPVACGIAAGNTLEALLGAWLLRLAGAEFDRGRWRLREALGLVVLAAGLSTTVSATVGVTSLCLGGVQPWADYGSVWWVWWLGDAMGNLVVAPALLAWWARPRVRWQPHRAVEAALLLAGLGALSAVVFFLGGRGPFPGYPLEYLIFPFVIWAALRFGQRGAATVPLVALALALIGTLDGSGPFVRETRHESLILLHLYMAVVAVTALLLGVVATERRTAERRQAAGYAATAALATSSTLRAAAPRLLREVCENLGWDVGALWVPDPHQRVVRCIEVWSRPPGGFPEFERVCREIVFPPGRGLPGRVWATGQPAWIADVTSDTNFPRAPAAARDGLHGAFSFPIVLGDETLGVIEFFSRDAQEPDEDLLRMMTALGSQIGLFIEREQADAGLREAEEQFRAMFESAQDAILVADDDGRYVAANPAACALLGLPEEEVLRRRIADFLEPGFDFETAWKVFRQRRRERGEIRLVRADGTVCEVEYSAISEVRPGRHLSILRDVTERKRAETLLAGQGRVLEMIARGVPLPEVLVALVRLVEEQSAGVLSSILLLDGAGRLRHGAAPGLPETYQRAIDGVAIGPAVGSCGTAAFRREAVIVADIATDPLWADFRDLALGHGLRACWSVPIFATDGTVLGTLAMYYRQPQSPAPGEARFAVEVAAHLAGIAIERTRAEEALRQRADQLAETDRRKDEFLAMLAHELRNPLAPVCNALHVLGMPDLEASEAAQLREMMERQIAHLVRLVDDLLDVSRIMRGKITLRKEPLDLAAVVARAVETARPVLDAQKHRLTVALPPESVRLEGDLVRLSQVLANLLNNAAKYTEPGGRITLTAELASAGRESAGEIVLRVRDDGIGIDAEFLSHIFEPFVQAHKDGPRSQGGLGIGLTLVKRLVELHGGTVTAHSAGRAQGSEFVIRLPILECRVAMEEKAGAPDHKSTINNPKSLRILVVDDNEDAANSLTVILRLQGHEVRVAYDGASALGRVRADPPDVVFLDLGMPGMDGYEVARRLRLEPALNGVRLVALTGWGQEQDRLRTQEAGFACHLTKPADLEALRRLLAGLTTH